MKGLFVVTALAAIGLAGCQTGMSYADAQALCEAQGYRVGSKRFNYCVDDLFRYPSNSAVAVSVVEEPVYAVPGPVVIGGYVGSPYYGRPYYGRRYYGRPYYGRPYYGGYYWR